VPRNIFGPSAAAAALCAAALLAVGPAGCAAYRLGSTLPAGLKSIHVPTFVNQCGEPQVESEAVRATIQEFQKDGTLRIADERDADLRLDVTLVDYSLAPIRFRREMTRTAQEYRMTLAARIVLTRRSNGEVLTRTRVIGESTFEPGGDLTLAKRQALPKTARDLAHNIVESVVEVW
jgi:hypothetical protein